MTTTLPDLNLPSLSAAPSYLDIMRMLQTPTATNASYLPELQNILSPNSQYLAPALAGIKDTTNTNLADMQGLMGKRLMEGSSIEAVGLGNVMAQGQQTEAQLRGNFALQGANTFAGYYADAMKGDVTAQRNLVLSLAQAMGEELTSERDIQMFQEQLAQALKVAQMQSDDAGKASWLGLLGDVLKGGAIVGGAMIGGPVGAGVGAAVGGTVAGSLK